MGTVNASFTGTTAASSTAADPIDVTCASHPFSTGNVVLFTAFDEMTALNGSYYNVESLDANSLGLRGVGPALTPIDGTVSPYGTAETTGGVASLGLSSVLRVPAQDEVVTVTLTGTWVATLALEREKAKGSDVWTEVKRWTANTAYTFITQRENTAYRLRLVAYTSGTITAVLADAARAVPLSDVLVTDEDGVTITGTLSVSGASTLTGAVASGALTSTGAIADGAASTLTTGAQIGNLTLADGSITDSGGAISFGDESLTTTGALASGAHTQTALNITTLNIGAVNGSEVVAVENGDGIYHSTVLTCTAAVIDMADDAAQGQYGGTKIYDFPVGHIAILGCTCDGDFTAVETWLDTWAGDMCLGTAAPTDAQSTEAGEDNIQQLTATGTASALVAAIDASVQVAAVLTESGARWFNGTDTAVDLFLNMITDDDDGNTNTTGAMLFTGTITVNWVYLGTIAA